MAVYTGKSGGSGEKLAVHEGKTGDPGDKSAVNSEKDGGSDDKPELQMIRFEVIVNLCKAKRFNNATVINFEKLYRNVDVNQIFSAAYVRKILSCADSTARTIITKLKELDVLVPVSGKGKGMYRFNYDGEK